MLNDWEQTFQPGISPLWNGATYEQDGCSAEWRGATGDKGRWVVAICHNMELGDAWEWADNLWYPEKPVSPAYRAGVSYSIDAMTH